MKTVLCILSSLFLCSCSHISIADAKWISANATNIAEVEERLGAPETEVYGQGFAESHYIDKGFHTFPLAIIPFINVATFPIWLADLIFFKHERFLIIRYSATSGRIMRISSKDPLQLRGSATNIRKY